MRVAISQPCFLPYKGYFELINSVDVFVFYDDVEFSRQSWQQRNKVKWGFHDHWLTVPVKRKYKQLIKDVKISKGKEVDDIRRTVRQFLKLDLPIIKTDSLCELNIGWIKYLCELQGIKTKFVLSSNIKNKSKDKIQKLIDICLYNNAKTYVMTAGCKSYFKEKETQLFNSQGINVEIKTFEPSYSVVNYLGR